MCADLHTPVLECTRLPHYIIHIDNDDMTLMKSKIKVFAKNMLMKCEELSKGRNYRRPHLISLIQASGCYYN